MTLGIDSGSTTTKLVAFDDHRQLLFTYYTGNDGNPIGAVERGLRALHDACRAAGADAVVRGSCVTGYGEDLIRAAFGVDAGMSRPLPTTSQRGRLRPTCRSSSISAGRT